MSIISGVIIGAKRVGIIYIRSDIPDDLLDFSAENVWIMQIIQHRGGGLGIDVNIADLKYSIGLTDLYVYAFHLVIIYRLKIYADYARAY